MSKSQYYVYVYFDPVTLTPFYVGKGKNDRYRFHIKEAKQFGEKKPVRFQNIPKIKRIRAILDSGQEPIIIKVLHGSHEKCLEEEKRLINVIARVPQGPLLNMTDGGDGTEGFKHKQETRELFSNQRKGKAVTRHSEEWKQHLRENNAGGKATRKRVCKFTQDGKLVETFESMASAARSVGMTKNNFSFGVVKDGSIPRGEHFYRYEDSTDITEDGIKNADKLILKRERHTRGVVAGKSVKKTTDHGASIIYESIKEASRAHPNIKYATLWAAINYERKCADALWAYC